MYKYYKITNYFVTFPCLFLSCVLLIRFTARRAINSLHGFMRIKYQTFLVYIFSYFIGHIERLIQMVVI